MGVGGKKRYLKPEDFGGRKVRSMGPAENPVLESWKANPVVMGFGEVPTALESGVIDGLMTSIGGWLERARAGALLHDRRRRRLHRRLLHGEREPALVGPPQPGDARPRCEKLIAETIQVQKEFNWCVDKLTYQKYGTKDPSKPGVYWMTPQEVSALTGALGEGADPLGEEQDAAGGEPSGSTRSVKEGRELSEQNPPGSSWIEKIDCSKHASKIVIK